MAKKTPKMILKIGKNNFGFTLIELLIVVCIIGVVAGISLPKFSKTFDNVLLDNYAKDIVYLMRFAYLRSISDGFDYRMNFEKGSNNCFLTRKEGNTYKKISDRQARLINVSKKIKLNSNIEYIPFKANGQTESFSIILTSNSNKRISIINEGIFFNVKIIKS